MKKQNVYLCLNIVKNIIFIFFILLCAFVLCITILCKRDVDGTARLFGYQMRVVISSSMEKCDLINVSEYKIKDIPTKSLIFIKEKPINKKEVEKWYSSLKVGDVLMIKYLYAKQESITHRIVEIQKNKDEYVVTLQGDNINSDNNKLTQIIHTSQTESPNYIVGKVVGVNHFLGKMIVALKQPVGICCIIIFPCILIILFEIIRIIKIKEWDKQKTMKRKQEEKELEVEELKRQIEELKKI